MYYIGYRYASAKPHVIHSLCKITYTVREKSLYIPSQIHRNNICKCLWNIILTKKYYFFHFNPRRNQVHTVRTGTIVLIMHWFNVHHFCIYDHDTCKFYVKMSSWDRTSHSTFPNKGQCVCVSYLSYNFRWYAPIYILKRSINPKSIQKMRSFKIGYHTQNEYKQNKKNIIQQIKAKWTTRTRQRTMMIADVRLIVKSGKHLVSDQISTWKLKDPLLFEKEIFRTGQPICDDESRNCVAIF